MADDSLRLDPGSIRTLAHQAADIIADYLTEAPSGPPIRHTTLAAVTARVGGALPLVPADPAGILEQIAADIAPYGVHNSHPRFFGYVGTSALVSAILADGIATALNLNVVTSKSRPTAVGVELTVVDWLRQMLGLSEGAGGILTTGGTMANLLCLAAARQARAPGDARREGMRGLEKPLALYASQEAHVCHRKIAELLGLGSGALRMIPSDAYGRLDIPALQRTIKQDRDNGVHPLAVIASAGTTSLGAVDPVADLADLCEAERIWLHVDACYGGFAILAADALDQTTRYHLNAMARADSVAADPHKFLFMPVEAGAALLREPRHLWDAFHVSADYLAGGDFNFFEYGPATSRAFRALKIWAGLRHHGVTAIGAAISANIRQAARLRALVEAAPDLEPVGPAPELSVVCYRYVPADLAGRPEAQGYIDRLNDRLVADLQESGEAYVSATAWGGRPVIRACIVNYRTTDDDVDRFVALTRRLGAAADAAVRSTNP